MGKEPDVFDGSRDKVEGFLTVWNVYRSLNRRTTTMDTAFDRTMLFLGYIRGPKVDEWVKDQIGIVLNHLEGGGRYTDEWIWDTVVNEFARCFQDIMSKERARMELSTLKMERGDLDGYNSKFRHLARLGGYRLQDEMLWERYFKGLPNGLQRSVIDSEPVDFLRSLTDWEEAAIRQHRKFLRLQVYFGKPNPSSNTQKRPTRQQWQQGFAKDPNAMDLTPGRTRARAALTDDEYAQLRKEGKCFHCKKQGHLSRNCPLKAGGSRVRATGEEPTVTTTGEQKVSTPAQIKRISAQELVGIVRDMEPGEKDKVIQEVFMNEDFA